MGLVLDLPNIVGNETDPPAWGELGRSGFNLFGSQCPYSRMGRTLYFNRRAFGLSASLLPHGANCYPSDVFQQVGSVSTPAWGEPRGSLFTYDRLQRLYSRMGRTVTDSYMCMDGTASLLPHGANHWITNELHTKIHPYSDFVRPMREQIPGQRRPMPTSNQAETGSLPAKSNMANVDGSIQVCVLLETALLALELRL